MKRQLAYGIFILALASLACRVSITPTPTPTKIPTITATVTLTPVPTLTQTPTPTSTPALAAYSGPALLELHMFNATRGWGLTENQILITRDGGDSWAQVPLADIPYNPSITTYFIDPDIAYFFVPGTASQPGQFLGTRDSGANWENNITPFDNAEIYFSDDNNGFAMQTLSKTNEQMPVAIYQTLDRGKTWLPVFTHVGSQSDTNLPAAGIKTGLSFIDSSQGFIGLRDQKNSVALYHALDAGRNWVKQELTLPDNLTGDYQSTAWPALFFPKNDTNGFAPVSFVNSVSGAATLIFYRTNDTGATWQIGGEVPQGTTYCFVDPQTGWAWGEHSLYTTVDGAKTWQPSPVAFNRSERASVINFVDRQNGWLITIDAKNILRMYRTNDGGATWTAMMN